MNAIVTALHAGCQAPLQPEVADLARRAATAASESVPGTHEEGLKIGEVRSLRAGALLRSSCQPGRLAGRLHAQRLHKGWLSPACCPTLGIGSQLVQALSMHSALPC